ncbi:MAG TPA: acyl-CoA dehydrogenase family protein, partial [Sneathiellales bacterium]|nr:acyl-CoA dehydrogenase family protein [Sneathiellales bacterium]
MNFELEPKYLAIQQEARDLAQSIEPISAEADASSEIHPGILSALQTSGMSNLMVATEYGGRFEQVDPFAICLVREVFMATSSHLDSLFALQGIGSFAITKGGTREQRENWLPKIATAEILPALALTEPDAGSDLKAITTELVPSGNGYLLRGTKAFISNAGAAGYYIVFAKEEAGFSTVLVPADAPGVSSTPAPELIAPHVLGDVQFDDVALTDAARLGEPGKGLNLVLAT